MKYPNKAIKTTRPPWMRPADTMFTRHQAQREGENASKEYDGEWARYSKAFLRENPTCCKCPGLAHLTDHVIPIRSGGSKWDRRNHQAMCHTCHNKKRAHESRGKIEPATMASTGLIPTRREHEREEIMNKTHLIRKQWSRKIQIKKH